MELTDNRIRIFASTLAPLSKISRLGGLRGANLERGPLSTRVADCVLDAAVASGDIAAARELFAIVRTLSSESSAVAYWLADYSPVTVAETVAAYTRFAAPSTLTEHVLDTERAHRHTLTVLRSALRIAAVGATHEMAATITVASSRVAASADQVISAQRAMIEWGEHRLARLWQEWLHVCPLSHLTAPQFAKHR
jgi:hypothetical protein